MQHCPWTLQSPARVMSGYVRGLRQPTLLLTLDIGPGDTSSIRQLSAVWAQEPAWVQATGLPPPPPAWHSRPDDALKAADWLLHWTRQLQRCAGLPVFETGLVLGHRMHDHQGPGPGPDQRHAQQPEPKQGLGSRLTLLVTTAHGQPQPALEAFQGVLSWFNQGLVAAPASPDITATDSPSPAILKSLSTLRSRLQTAAPGAANTPRFLQAAHELGLPVIPLGNGAYQFGQGRLGRWLQSSFTDATPNIATKMARDKAWAAIRLRQAGIPVPAHRLAADADNAERIAGELGFPVVVKPADQDGGLGVSAGLENAQEVRDAYAQARARSTRVLVEKQVSGRDYRLTVLNGQLIWAIERQPGGVIGDGASTLEQLITRTNADPRRGEGPHAPLKRLLWDTEARILAAKAGLAEHTIPPAGRFVRLRRTANVATGGKPVAVTGEVHPDNTNLAIRAAQALRLDLAGVDLLLPDITRSWRETGAAVCEVNAQPQLGAVTAPHLYGQILGSLVPGDGRIPIIVVLGAAPGSRLAERLAVRLDKECSGGTGWSDERGVAIDLEGEREWLTARRQGSFAAAQMLLTHTGVDRLVWSLNDDETARFGLPFDRFDLLILAGYHLTPAPGRSSTETPEPREPILKASLAAALPACTKAIFSLTEAGIQAKQGQGATGTRRVHTPMAPDDLVARVVAHCVQLQQPLTIRRATRTEAAQREDSRRHAPP